jgi:Sulfatase
VELKPKGPTLGESSYIPPEKRFGFDYWKACECSHEYNHPLYYEGNDPSPNYWPGYDALAQTDDACDFIKKRAVADPFLLVLSLGPPHFPYATAPERYREMYRGRELHLRRNVPADMG